VVFESVIDQVIENCFDYINQVESQSKDDKETPNQLLHKIFFLFQTKQPRIVSKVAISLQNPAFARRAFSALEYILNISNQKDVLDPPSDEIDQKPKDFWLTQASRVGLEGNEKEMK